MSVPLTQALGADARDFGNLEQLTVNWRKILKYATVLFLLRFALSILEGFFSEDLGSSAIWGWVTLFLVSAAVFAHMSAHQATRPLSHALLVVVVEQALGAIASLLIVYAIPELAYVYSWPILIVTFAELLLDYAGLAGALVIGTAVGLAIGHRRAASTPRPSS